MIPDRYEMVLKSKIMYSIILRSGQAFREAEKKINAGRKNLPTSINTKLVGVPPKLIA